MGKGKNKKKGGGKQQDADDDDWEALLEAEAATQPPAPSEPAKAEADQKPAESEPASAPAQDAAAAFLAAQGIGTGGEDGEGGGAKNKKKKKKKKGGGGGEQKEDSKVRQSHWSLSSVAAMESLRKALFGSMMSHLTYLSFFMWCRLPLFNDFGLGFGSRTDGC